MKKCEIKFKWKCRAQCKQEDYNKAFFPQLCVVAPQQVAVSVSAILSNLNCPGVMKLARSTVSAD